MTALRPSGAVARRLHAEADAARWGVSADRLSDALEASAAKAFDAAPSARDAEAYWRGLHLADLAVACACADGHDAAWEHVIRQYRPVLYRAAQAMAPDGSGRELADSLYGELFAAGGPGGERRSLFRYYHGRSSLGTWLRAILAQRYVDRVRVTRKLESLPDDDAPAALAQRERVPDPERPRWVAAAAGALSRAIAALEPRDRLRLACYYAQNLTLAEIGRTLGEHEATASRHLARTRRVLRDAVGRDLRDREGLSEQAVAECLASVVEDAGPLDLEQLVQAPLAAPGPGAVRKNADLDRST